MPRFLGFAYRGALVLALAASAVLAVLTGAGAHAPTLPRLPIRVATPSAAASVPPGAVSAPRLSVSPAPAAEGLLPLPRRGGALVTP